MADNTTTVTNARHVSESKVLYALVDVEVHS